ncbi:MAG: ankyrin repeat domain-containing protein [Blastocatellia bacterium]
MRVRAGWLLCLWGSLIFPSLAQTANLNEELLAAARKGNAEAIKSLLAKGADVNAKSPYGATPLFFACDRGNAEVVKLLLDAGADVNIRDTFYKSTPLTWAIQRDHEDVVKLLVEKSPELKESATAQSVMQGQAKTAAGLLALGGFKPESLAMWLSIAEKNGATEIVESLKKAGARPRVKTEFKIDPEQLKRYEGAFKNEQFELVVKVKGDNLIGSANGFDLTLNPTAEHTFEPKEQVMTLIFRLEAEKVAALVIKTPGGETLLKKVEGK